MFWKKTGLLILYSVLLVVVVVGVNAVPDARTDHEQWVVSVPQGLERAKRLAQDHDLQFLGEVIPETNLFHLSVKEQHRRKRSVLQNVHQSLTGHPDIEAVHPQSEVLTRVRRRPFDDEEQFLTREKRQVSGARSSAGEGKEVCFINTRITPDKGSSRCIFPFNYKGKSYFKCTRDHSSNGVEWCATQVNKEGDVVVGQWGDCDLNAISCIVVGSSENRIQPGRPAQGSGPPPPPPQREAQFNPAQGFQQGPGFGPEAGFRPQQFLDGGFPQQKDAFPPGFFPGGPSKAGSFRPGALPSLNRLPLAPHRQQPGFPPGQQFPFAANFLQGSAPKKGVFPPESVDPSLLNQTSQLMNHFNDKAWPYMWFLNRGGRGSHGLDMNVDEAWAQGVSGKGVVVTILDDGIEWDHPDLAKNYDKDASIDLNDNDADPAPRYDIFNSNKHGTRCAGTVAAVANNSMCAVGIAYNSKVGGIRILDGNILDALEARALSFNRDHIDIYSASWGPDDNGQTVDGPGLLASMALRDGVNKGRNGKGSVFVWASGNGGKFSDNCNCDGYTTSIYTLSVSSASEQGTTPWYSEACSSSLATTFSSGSKSKTTTERKVVTTDLHGECTDQHTGTSASSPMAAGIIALALESNPDLTWRDLQHLVIRTSRPRGLLKAKDWEINGVGLQFSHSYGFGLMDAGRLVNLAKRWKPVPEHRNCTTETEVPEPESATVAPMSEEVFEMDASECNTIKFLEHIQLHIDLSSQSARGDLSILLRSPAGTVSTLLAERPNDNIRTGLSLFKAWPLMSVHFWGEPVSSEANGSTWVLLIKNAGDGIATLNGWKLTFYGTDQDPQPGIPIEVEVPDVKPDAEVLTIIPELQTVPEADEVSEEVRLQFARPDEALEAPNQRDKPVQVEEKSVKEELTSNPSEDSDKKLVESDNKEEIVDPKEEVLEPVEVVTEKGLVEVSADQAEDEEAQESQTVARLHTIPTHK